MPKSLVLYPAYGRVYDNAKECLKDWQAGKDFLISGGPYCSIRDIQIIKRDGYTSLVFGRHNGTFLITLTI